MAKKNSEESLKSRVSDKATETYTKTKTKIRNLNTGERIRKHPMASFLLSLLVLFLVIMLGSFLTKTPPPPETKEQTKQVSVYKVGGGSEITTQARIQKTGVIKIYAQAPGVVQSVSVKEGDEVQRGQNLVNLSTNYTGGNAAGVQTQIAAAQYQNTIESYATQKDLLEKQRQVANLTNSNTDELRQISAQSVGETRDLVNLNRQIIDGINANIAELEANNTNGSNDALILQARQAKSQVQSGINQLDANLRNLEYQTNAENDPTRLSDLQKEITLKGLDLQEKSLELGKKVSGLQLTLAQIQASLMYPASPTNGSVQKVHVVFGQSVNPGTLLVTIFQPEHENTATAFVPGSIAPLISQSEPSTLTLSSGKKITLAPRFVSAEATDGQLYSVLYELPADIEKLLTDGQFISISIPVSEIDAGNNQPKLIPVDAVFQGEDSSSVFVIANGKAVEKKITTGRIIGGYIEVQNGISDTDQIILDRNIVAGDSVTVSGS